MDPIIAIVGSARKDIMGEKEADARRAAQQIGTALAKAGWRIAVYGSDPDYIERDVVKGYIAAGIKKPKSITCIYPRDVDIDFEDMNSNMDYFKFQKDMASDWEVSFYRSIITVDAMLLFGGKNSAFIAGQMALSYNLPVVAIASFPGSARKVWFEHLSKKPGNIDDMDLQVMGTWTPDSPAEIIDSLNRQYQKSQNKTQEEKEKIKKAQQKAALYDLSLEQSKSKKTKLAFTFLVLFIVSFIFGLIASVPAWLYTTVTILSLAISGGMGATIRMVMPKPPEVESRLNSTIIGIMVGLVFSLIYLIPQLAQKSGFLMPDSMKDGIDSAARAQFVCATLVAVLAGLGFDYAIEQLVRRAQRETQQLANPD
jgi:hypothetical protein